MTATRWERIQLIFHAALDAPASGREALLDDHCEGDTELRREVEALLAANEAPDSFIIGTLQNTAAELLGHQNPSVIGPYSVLRALGQGGMGTVYLAARSDDEYRKQVAIKLISAAWPGSDAVRQFRLERQILADLDHPGIARLFDGGTTQSGLPYVVMEYVDGKPIDAYCRDENLSIPARLQLFCKVCEAVSYAHQHLIVHRDIKPANILVTRNGEPKLLDFGIAKLLDRGQLEPFITRRDQRMLTLEYASPEQVRGGAITTVSDVYSLGVLLYTLLSGAPPFQFEGKSTAQCEQLICEATPLKPSAIAKQKRELAGDLDSITLKALRKEAGRRYASADQLSGDIQRHLKGLPVQARPDTWQYRSRKFVERNKVGVSLALLAILFTAAAMAAIVSAERRAQAARIQAQQRFQDVLALANSSLFEIHDSISSLPGSTQATSLLVHRALQYLDLLSRDNSHDPALQRELADAYEKLSDIQYHEGPGRLGDSAGALASAGQALLLRQALARQYPSPKNQAAVAADLVQIADVQFLTREVAQSVQNYRAAVDIYERLQKVLPEDDLRPLGRAYNFLGRAESQSGNLSLGLLHIHKALDLDRARIAASPQDVSVQRDLEVASIALSDIQREQLGDPQAALASTNQALAIATALNAKFPNNVLYRADLASSSVATGRAYADMRQPEKALQFYLRSFSIIQAMAASDPADQRLRRSVSIHSNNVAAMLARLGRLSEAEHRYKQSLAIAEGLAQADLRDRQAQDDLAYVRVELGRVLLREGDVSGGLRQLETALAVRTRLASENADDVVLSFRLALNLGYLGDAQLAIHQWKPAQENLQREEAILQSLQGKMSVSRDLEHAAASLKESARHKP